MTTPKPKVDSPPPLAVSTSGGIENSSLADLVEWFLNYDERTARVRLPYTEELFQWKQQDDRMNGKTTFPFENAEARFAIGVIQALHENPSEPQLQQWIEDVLSALHDAREARSELTEAYGLDADAESTAVEKAEKLGSDNERRLYLTSCWLEQLCTAEVRVLGWVYQELYGRPFSPAA